MALWSRLRQSKRTLCAFSNETKRFYYLNCSPAIANQLTSPATAVPILKSPNFIVQDSQLELFRQVRCFEGKIQKGPPTEVSFSYNIKDNDLKIKADMARRLMETGNRVKVTWRKCLEQRTHNHTTSHPQEIEEEGEVHEDDKEPT